MATYKGVGCHFGVSSTSWSGLATGSLQTRDYSKLADMAEIKDATGNIIQKTYFNNTEEATFEVIVTGGAAGSSDIDPTLGSIGDVITVTDTKFTDIAGTNWLVEGVDVKGASGDYMKVSYKLKAIPAISS